MKLKIISYNVALGPMRSEKIGINIRAKEIVNELANLDKNLDLDIICFQEVWQDELINKLKIPLIGNITGLNKLIKGIFHKTNLDSLNEKELDSFTNSLSLMGYKYYAILNRSTLRPKGSGLLITSKYPIIYANGDHFSLKNKEINGTDLLSSKGFLHSKIKKNNIIFNIITTHFQNGIDKYYTRLLEADHISKYIEKSNIPQSEPIIICGDFNEDLSNKNGYNRYLNTILNSNIIRFKINSYPYTMNINNKLHSIDGEQLPKSVCCDYFMLNTQHRLPKKASQTVIPLMSRNTYDINIKIGNKYLEQTQDLSDHYPVLSVMDF